VGADILVRAPGSAIIGFSTNFPEKVQTVVAQQPHVSLVTGTLVQPIGMTDSVTGIDYEAFSKMSGGFRFLEGGPFQGPDDVIIDEAYAKGKNLRAGAYTEILNRKWRVSGVVETGKLSRLFLPLRLLQDLSANTGKLTVIYVKLDNTAATQETIAKLKDVLTDYKIFSMEEFISLISVNNIPMLKQFIRVIIALGVLIGFLVVFLSMYTAVLERTREIGILKSLGATPFYILNVLLRETVLLSVAGTVIGILLTYGTKWLITSFVPTMAQAIVPDWWPIAAAISIFGALLGALYPGLKAASQDAIEALAYE
jgi:putative ABC transport system permease protein